MDSSLEKKKLQCGDGESQRADSLQTPQRKKPKRKRYKPKVLRDWKPKRTLQSKTKTKKPSKMASKMKEDTPGSIKRKYVLKNKKEPASAQSVRRSLNFDDEQKQVDFDETKHVFPKKVTKREYNLVDSSWNLDAGMSPLSFPLICKKKASMRRKIEKKKTCDFLCCFLPNTFLGYSNFEQRKMMFNQAKIETNDQPVQAKCQSSCNDIVDCHKVSTPIEQPKHYDMDCNQPPTPQKVFECDNNQVNMIHGAKASDMVQEFSEAKNGVDGSPTFLFSSIIDGDTMQYPGVLPPLDKDSNSQPPTPEKDFEHNSNQERQSYGPQARIEILISIHLKSKGRKRKNKGTTSIAPKSVSSRDKNHEGLAFIGSSASRKAENSDFKDIIPRFGYGNATDHHEDGKAIVPYTRGGGMMVPFMGKKKRFRPIVALDLVSVRMWDIIVGNGSTEDPDATIDWENERRQLTTHIAIFINIMDPYLGNREFTKWKGSVLDAIAGVFLTQNVSDHLSSSAFMDLASTFPPCLEDDSNALSTGKINSCREDVASSYISRSSTKNSEQQFCDQSLLALCIKYHTNICARNEECLFQKASVENLNNIPRSKTINHEIELYWEILRRQALQNGAKERSNNTKDSVDYKAVRCANVREVANAIQKRGQHNILAGRIQEALDRLVRIHGSLDLEWLRDIPPDKAKDYLLDIEGLGPKSVDCVRLLSLQHQAFPVDTNIGRICVRLGWVPLQSLPESTQLHRLELYPLEKDVQKYLWPRLCHLNHETLYKLHYLLITFGKVFCTKSNPNCNACPMKSKCKHFKSAFVSSRPALQGPDETSLMSSTIPSASQRDHNSVPNLLLLPSAHEQRNCEPIIEEPTTPEHEFLGTFENDFEDIGDIEDAFYDDPDEIPTINLSMQQFTQNMQNLIQETNLELQDASISKALVSMTSEAASIPVPKLKDAHRLRTKHQVYVLNDDSDLLIGLEKRDPDDPCPYMLAMWSPGETSESTEPSKVSCNSMDGNLCDNNTCFSCNSMQQEHSQTVKCTLLVPSRTANRGSFPLNGTYFQVNEVFADHYTSCHPLEVPRAKLWPLKTRIVYFGTSVTAISKGLTMEDIQKWFSEGYVCVRAFDRTTRKTKNLCPRLHLSALEATKIRARVRPEAKKKDATNSEATKVIIT